MNKKKEKGKKGKKKKFENERNYHNRLFIWSIFVSIDSMLLGQMKKKSYGVNDKIKLSLNRKFWSV